MTKDTLDCITDYLHWSHDACGVFYIHNKNVWSTDRTQYLHITNTGMVTYGNDNAGNTYTSRYDKKYNLIEYRYELYIMQKCIAFRYETFLNNMHHANFDDKPSQHIKRADGFEWIRYHTNGILDCRMGPAVITTYPDGHTVRSWYKDGRKVKEYQM